MTIDRGDDRKEIKDIFLSDGILFILFQGGFIRGVDLARYLDRVRGNVLLFTTDELFLTGDVVSCVFWDNIGSLPEREAYSLKNNIFVRYGSETHKALDVFYMKGVLERGGKVWY